MKTIRLAQKKLLPAALALLGTSLAPAALGACIDDETGIYTCSGTSTGDKVTGNPAVTVNADSTYSVTNSEGTALAITSDIYSSANANVTFKQSAGSSIISTYSGSDAIGAVVTTGGNGFTSINIAGNLNTEDSSASYGLLSWTGSGTGSASATDYSLTQASTSAIYGKNGVAAIGPGTYGLYAIETAGSITGTEGDGITVFFSGSLALTQTGGTISGTDAGINITSLGDTGTFDYNISGTVTGGSLAGIYENIEYSSSGTTTNIMLNDGADVSATGGVAIQIIGSSATTVTLNSGSKISGSVLLSEGNGTLTINNGADVTEATIFNGGTDSDAANTNSADTDTLNIFQSLTGSSESAGSSGDILMTNWTDINIGSGSTDSGATLTLSGNLITDSITINSNGIIALAGGLTSATIGDGTVTNAGTINLTTNSSAGDTLTIEGDYVGNNGRLLLDTVLGDDSSVTDKLIVTGDASGITYVSVNNLGGTGAQTVEGIKVVEVGGTSTADAFVQDGRIVAGAYDYSLIKGSTSGNDADSWYLTSKYTDNSGGDGGNGGAVPILRPEAGSYIGNLAAANDMFSMRLHDRLGETQYTDLLTGRQKVTSIWMHYKNSRARFDAGSNQLANKTQINMFQLGGDVAQWSSNGENRFNIGAMAGYGRSTTDTDSRLSDYSSAGTVKGYSIGLYGTWYANNEDKTGWYADGWVTWSKFDASVSGEGLAKEKYHLDGFTLSAETGYTFKIGSSGNYSYWLQPKAQIIHMGVDADSHIESNGTRVIGNSDNWQSRLGVRLNFGTGESPADTANAGMQFFAETNWIHNTGNFAVEMDGARVSRDGARNIGEIKAGMEWNIRKNTNVWLNVAYQRGDHKYSNTGALIGAKYSF